MDAKTHIYIQGLYVWDPYICYIQDTHFRPKDTYSLCERMEKYVPCKSEAKESWGSNPHIRQIDLKIKIPRDKEGYSIKIKGSIQEEDITIVNIYAPNIGAPQYIRQTLTNIKGETDNNTIIVGTLTPHPHQWTDHRNRKLIRKHKSYIIH